MTTERVQLVLLKQSQSPWMHPRFKGLGFGKLPESWNKVPLSQTKIEKQTSDYFIVAVTNEEEKKTLYILISAYGEAYDANFTGKFEGLNSDK